MKKVGIGRRKKFQKLVTSVQNTGHLLIEEGFNSMNLGMKHKQINLWDTDILRNCRHPNIVQKQEVLLATSIITDQEFVFGASDFDSIHQILDHLVDYHKISAVIGLGINSYLDSKVEIEKLPSSQIKFLNYLLKEHSLIGCRGLETLDFLIAYGFPHANLFLSGCPSLHLIQPSLKEVPSSLSRILVSGALINHLDILDSMTTSNTKILAIPQTLESLSNMENVSKLDQRLEIFLPCSLRDWRTKIRKWNPELSVGTRFHGNVAAMSIGITSVFISGDIRTRELSQLTGLPYVSDLLEVGTAIESIKETTQLNRPEIIQNLRSQIFQRLKSRDLINVS